MVGLVYNDARYFVLPMPNARKKEEKNETLQRRARRRLPRLDVEAFFRELGRNNGSP
jgi:hypothetical protein